MYAPWFVFCPSSYRDFKYASRLFSITETMLTESEEKDWKSQTESGILTWKIHEVAKFCSGSRISIPVSASYSAAGLPEVRSSPSRR